MAATMTKLDYSKIRRSVPRTPSPVSRKVRRGFPAQWGNTCPLCHTKIQAGEMVRYWSNPLVAHVDCINRQG